MQDQAAGNPDIPYWPVASARKVPNTGWVTRLHNAPKYGGAGLKVSDYYISFHDGSYPLTVTAKDRAQAIAFAQTERQNLEDLDQRQAKMLENPHLIEQHTFVMLYGGGLLPAEKQALHRRYVEDALQRSEAIPSHVLQAYPDLAPRAVA